MTCSAGLLFRREGAEQRCIACEEELGYYTKQNGMSGERECGEICGDGLSMGENKCDDGNSLDGDGCSSQCQIEDGYICFGGNYNSPDKCKDISPPTIQHSSLSNTTQYLYYFQFTKPVKITSSHNPNTFLNLTITGSIYKYYDFDYNVDFDGKQEIFDNFTLFKESYYSIIIIGLIPRSSIMQDDVIYIYPLV